MIESLDSRRLLASVAAFFDLDRLHPAVRLTFDADVNASFSAQSLQLENLSAPFPEGLSVQLGNPAESAGLVRTLEIGQGGVIGDGNYELNLPRHGISPELATDFVHHDYFLNGDFNRDRAVTFADQLILSQNYGHSGKTWSQGDMNLDGSVDFVDLLLFAQRYGVSLSPQPTYEGALTVDPLPFYEDGSTPLRVVWTQHAGVDGYSVFRSNDGTYFERVHSMTESPASTAGYSWIDTTPTPGSKVWYRVRPYVIDNTTGSPATIHQHTTAKDWAVALLPAATGLAVMGIEPTASGDVQVLPDNETAIAWTKPVGSDIKTELVLQRRTEAGEWVDEEQFLYATTSDTEAIGFRFIRHLDTGTIYRIILTNQSQHRSASNVISQSFEAGWPHYISLIESASEGGGNQRVKFDGGLSTFDDAAPVVEEIEQLGNGSKVVAVRGTFWWSAANEVSLGPGQAGQASVLYNFSDYNDDLDAQMVLGTERSLPYAGYTHALQVGQVGGDLGQIGDDRIWRSAQRQVIAGQHLNGIIMRPAVRVLGYAAVSYDPNGRVSLLAAEFAGAFTGQVDILSYIPSPFA